MKTEIYYFTGTGNTLAAAKALAERTEGRLIPMASFLRERAVQSDAEIIGIVYPVYYAGLPAIVGEFAEKLVPEGRPYIFAAATFGGAAGLSFSMLKAKMEKRGLDLDACFGIHMPQNAFKKPYEKPQKVLQQASGRLKKISEMIMRKEKGRHHANFLLESVMIPFNHAVRNASRKAVAGFAGAPSTLEFDALIRLSDTSYTVEQTCDGCGTCAMVCPASNIEIQERHPVWKHRCENCLACARWCPQNAIGGGVISGYTYLHPDLKLSDMKTQKPDEQKAGGNE